MNALEKESFKKRICILLLTVLSIAAVFLIALNMKTVYAADDEEDTEDSYSDAADIREQFDGIVSILAEQDEQLSKITYIIAPGQLVDEWEGTSGTKTIGDELLYEKDSPAHKGVGITSVIGMMLLLVYGIIQIVKIAKDEKGSIESWLQLAIVLVLGIMALSYGGEILSFLDRLGLKLFSGIQKSIVGDTSIAEQYSSDYQQMWEAAKEGLDAGKEETYDTGNVNWVYSFVGNTLQNVVNSTSNFLVGTIFKVLMYFTYYSIMVGVYGLLFEMVIRRIFAPIAITGIAVDGLRSPGVRYLKNYFSLYIRLAMFVVIISLSCKAASWAMSSKGWASTSQVFGENKYFWEQAKDETQTFVGRTVLWGGGNLLNNLTLRPIINKVLTINCIRAATKALMNSTAQIAKEVVGGNG